MIRRPRAESILDLSSADPRPALPLLPPISPEVEVSEAMRSEQWTQALDVLKALRSSAETVGTPWESSGAESHPLAVLRSAGGPIRWAQELPRTRDSAALLQDLLTARDVLADRIHDAVERLCQEA